MGFLKILRDMTARMLLEESLKEKAEALTGAARRKDEFLAMLAHELRNPLSAISNAIQLMHRTESPEHHRRSREVIRSQVEHLGRMIDDLLDIARVAQGKVELREESLELTRVIHRAVEVARPLIDRKRHEITVSLAPGAMRIEADPTRLEQILVNLLNNAAKYMEQGGKIRLTAEPQGGEIVIKIGDTGIGIAAETLPHVFDLFAQASRSLDRSQGGLGIGLTLVRKLAEMHGGSASAASEGHGLGAEFTLRLPATVARGEDNPPARPAETAGDPRRILIVDDNIDAATLTATILELSGHHVSTAFDGRAAVEAARAHRPEVILLDIGLPGKDGFRVAEELRREECGRDALIIAVTGYGDPEARERSRAAGFDHHLVKPVDPEILIGLIGRPDVG